MENLEIENAYDLEEEIQTLTSTQLETESQVIVHIGMWALLPYNIRIWGSTYLFDHNSDHHSKLVHFENITLAPEWMPVRQGKLHVFTLIFSGLPKSCTMFDLREIADGPGNFEFKNIIRNKTDVYHLETHA
jgi:hypothetical protein